MRSVVVGAGGFVGGWVLRELGREGEAIAVPAAGRDPAAVAAEVVSAKPAAIVNAAAMANIAACEADPAAARRANAALPAHLARAAAALGARFLHLSTDQVFDGSGGWYRETDVPRPISAYGRTKVAGEEEVLRIDGRAAVLRLNLVHGPRADGRASSSDEIVERARRGEAMRFYEDEHRSPIAVEDAASAIAQLVRSEFEGILHLGGPERLSRLELGRRILAAHGLQALATPASLREHRGPPRAPDTSFDSRRAALILDRPPRPLTIVLEERARRRP